MNNSDYIIIDELSSGFGAAGAIFCSITGIIFNSISLYVLWFNPNVKKNITSPLLFMQGLCDLSFSIGCLPIIALRFILRDKVLLYLPESFCDIFASFMYANFAVSMCLLSMISLSRLLVAFEYDKKYFSWKWSFFYFILFWLIAYTILAFPISDTWGKCNKANSPWVEFRSMSL